MVGRRQVRVLVGLVAAVGRPGRPVDCAHAEGRQHHQQLVARIPRRPAQHGLGHGPCTGGCAAPDHPAQNPPDMEDQDAAARGGAHGGLVGSVLNPGFQYKLWVDADISRHIAARHPELLPVFDMMKPIERADLFRYVIVFDEGGYYADVDVAVRRPIDEWLQATNNYFNTDLIVGFESITQRDDWRQWFARQFQFCQWTFAARAGHPVLKRVIDLIVEFF